MDEMERIVDRKQSLSSLLLALRRERGLTQAQVAELAGCSVGYYSRIESGKEVRATHEMLVKLANAIEVSVVLLETAAQGEEGISASRVMALDPAAYFRALARVESPQCICAFYTSPPGAPRTGEAMDAISDAIKAGRISFNLCLAVNSAIDEYVGTGRMVEMDRYWAYQVDTRMRVLAYAAKLRTMVGVPHAAHVRVFHTDPQSFQLDATDPGAPLRSMFILGARAAATFSTVDRQLLCWSELDGLEHNLLRVASRVTPPAVTTPERLGDQDRLEVADSLFTSLCRPWHAALDEGNTISDWSPEVSGPWIEIGLTQSNGQGG